MTDATAALSKQDIPGPPPPRGIDSLRMVAVKSSEDTVECPGMRLSRDVAAAASGDVKHARASKSVKDGFAGGTNRLSY